MKSKIHFCKLLPAALLFFSIFLIPSEVIGKKQARQAKVFGNKGNIRVSPYLFNGYSKNRLFRTRGSFPYGYGILHNNIGLDTIKIIALRVEFRIDSSIYTTGNGLFGIYRESKGTPEDLYEESYYKAKGGTGYIYDNLPHDSLYFADHLEFVKKYFWKVSNKRLCIEYAIYPKGPGEADAYKVPEKMTKYSPGGKRDEESWDSYYYRRTVGLMEFVRDAIHAADSLNDSPFRNLQMGSDGLLYEIDPTNSAIKRKAAILIFHAGASYLTDGGWDGFFGQDTPSDMIDAFISQEFFNYFADTINGIDTDSLNNISGIIVNKKLSNEFILSELMMVSETSNQDSLNWGIHGIMVNQVARQLGIPDLFSTMSGISGIGGFCIMDFAGYSSGRGFIPPWPSAWVRAFMGWDTPKVLEPGQSMSTANLTAICQATAPDTSILLIPINNHEFYLVENRQRNLTGNPALFNYDSVNFDNSNPLDDTIYISPFDHVNLDSNVITTFTHPVDDRNVIDSVHNFDISIPASGICIWHVDEYIIRDHLEQNVVNADSTYRGISLEEADGIVDLGIMFQDVFYQAAFDYGGAEDIFPHQTSKSTTIINSMGPFTRPSTKSNDGGHTYLSLAITPSAGKSFTTVPTELSAIRDYYVKNFVDTVFSVSLSRENQSVSSFANWPKRVISDKFFEPVLCDVYSNGDTLELAVVDTSGRVYVWSAADDDTLFTEAKEALPAILYSDDTLYYDTLSFLARIPIPASMPTCIDTSVYIPSQDGNLYILRGLDKTSATWDTVNLNSPASSYVCNYDSTKWAVGCLNGTIAFGDDKTGLNSTVAVSPNFPVQALASIDAAPDIIAAMNSHGLLTICSASALLDSIRLGVSKIVDVYPPFNLVTADLDQDEISDIVVSDKKQGVWLYNYNAATNTLAFDKEWIGWPNDWAGYHRLDTNRSSIPDNESAPAIADLDNDNVLDILVGGTNGIYAYNSRGVLLVEWPALLDTRFWYQRGSITSTPVIAMDPDKSGPLVVFSAPTGENVTFAVANIYSTDPNTGTIYYIRKDGIKDSISGLTSSFIDSLLVLGDSLVLPYITPGGFIDAFNSHGKRPDTIVTLQNVGQEIRSNWPFSVGGSITTSPLLCDMDNNNKTDIIAVAEGGWIYRWEVSGSIVSDSLIWPQAGANNSRTFSYGGPLQAISFGTSPAIEHFYNFPNPVKDAPSTSFKYRLTKPAKNVRLDIYTYTGYHIVSDKDLPSGFGWNEHAVSIRKFGSAVYRCRLEADFDGTKKVKYWKMAVIK